MDLYEKYALINSYGYIWDDCFLAQIILHAFCTSFRFFIHHAMVCFMCAWRHYYYECYFDFMQIVIYILALFKFPKGS